ncbi:MAG TPA: penicillin acylase family protein [Herpetosiphonaceae bacterium]
MYAHGMRSIVSTTKHLKLRVSHSCWCQHRPCTRDQHWAQFREALRAWCTPVQHVGYADVVGTITYQMTSQVPIRAPQHSGLVPLPRWTNEYAWQGCIPYEELPPTANPPQGCIGTANNKVVSDDYPYSLSPAWDPGYRDHRMSDMQAQRATLSPEQRTLPELLAHRQAAQAASAAAAEPPPVDRRTIPLRTTAGPAPLSFDQQRLWLLDQFQPR